MYSDSTTSEDDKDWKIELNKAGVPSFLGSAIRANWESELRTNPYHKRWSSSICAREATALDIPGKFW